MSLFLSFSFLSNGKPVGLLMQCICRPFARLPTGLEWICSGITVDALGRRPAGPSVGLQQQQQQQLCSGGSQKKACLSCSEFARVPDGLANASAAAGSQ
eukprot:1145153-Pelagomonas_calceolata.AAC.1